MSDEESVHPSRNGHSAANVAVTCDPEVIPKAERRRFTAEYKLRILSEADACTQRGEIGALLRREGFYWSHLDKWRAQRRMAPVGELFISVDVETAGPHPSHHALLSIGACLAFHPAHTFYVELQPDQPAAVPEALAISRLLLSELAERGQPPAEALVQVEAWIREQTPAGGRPVFVAFNAPFDWMFVADYFHRYLGRNPFGHNALDLKALYMGLTGTRWIGPCSASLRSRKTMKTKQSYGAARIRPSVPASRRTVRPQGLRNARPESRLWQQRRALSPE